MKKSKRKFKKYPEINDNENSLIQNPWDEAKEVLRVKFIAIQSYLKKQTKKPKKKNKTKQNKKH